MECTDFSLSVKNLCDVVEQLVVNQHAFYFQKDESPDFYIEEDILYINLGFKQGWVIVDPEKCTAHHVSDIDDELTEKNVCNSYLAEVLYREIADDLILAILEESENRSDNLKNSKNILPL